MDLDKQQHKLEEEMYSAGMDRWVEQNRSKSSKEAGTSDWNSRLTKVFLEPLVTALEADMQHYAKSKRKLPIAIQYLQQCDLHEVAFITIRVLLNEVTCRDTSSMQYVQGKIVQHIEDQLRFATLGADDKRKKYLDKVQQSLKEARSKDYNHKRNVYATAERNLKVNWVDWPHVVTVQLGSYLIKQVVKTLVDVHETESGELIEDPLFETRLLNMRIGTKFKTVRIVAVTTAYTEYIADFIVNHRGLFPEALPCVIPPRDWVSPFKGGYHSAKMASRCPLIKTDKEHAKILTLDQMPVTYEAINWLQQVKWKVNTDVLDIAQEVLMDIDHRSRPSVVDREPPANPVADRLNQIQDELGVSKLSKADLEHHLSDQELLLFRQWKAQKRDWHMAVNESRSKVLEFSRVIRIAEKYSIYEDIYFVWNLDYRQRFYTYTSGLGPQSSDVAKSLLRFSEEHELGKGGHYWYKIHGAGIFGYDKEDIDDRLAFAESDEFVSMVKRIADDPVNCLEWMQADKKKRWQFLAWALDYAKLLEWVESGKCPSKFKTFVSCQQDGSCSGLQHYSAMLRDEVGGAAVNLIDSSLPQDIYQDVVDLVIRDVERDMLSEDEGLALMAQKWNALGMSRKLTKVPVMTICYSSTRMTCRESVSDYLTSSVDALKEEGYGSPFEQGLETWAAESYMCDLVWNRIGDVIVKAKEGMRFYQEIAKAYSKAGQPMYITAITGFIMKQVAYQTTSTTVDTVLHGRMQFKTYEATSKIDARKMATMGPPNGIHLQDSSHVALTVVDAKRKGIRSLWVVHDDFGTHGGYTGHLHKSLRSTMVAMYRENVLQGIKDEAVRRIGNKLVDKIKVPEYGDLKLESILESKYAFL